MSEHSSKRETTDLDREVIRCKTCGLVQYRTRTGNCRRCLRLLPSPVEFALPAPAPQELPGDDRQLFESWPNRDTVENIGQRIRQLRESRGMTQSQLQARSRVSRSYLSRIESGQMTPSLGTLEKISEALGVGLNRFFIPESNGELLMEDPFIQGLRPYLRQLDSEQWEWILKRLQAITDHVTAAHAVAPSRPNGTVYASVRSISNGNTRPIVRVASQTSMATAAFSGRHRSPLSKFREAAAGHR
ncbi:MAG TPA: helix-turn-helix domain-containing protein [Candidatus Acidoferrales bacterium]|nr:helix-turn-helix domain-containing protein [Candidatus Acidoferrales bacterium]